MIRRLCIIGALALSPLVAMAADRPADQPQVRTITVQGGQGNAITLRLPIHETAAPYAFSGNATARPVKMVPMQFGQGGLILVPQAD